jgi:mevalonate kinase
MLLGEHAVLANGHAMVTAIDKYLTVAIGFAGHNPLPKCTIYSENFGSTTINLYQDFALDKPFEFVLSALKLLQDDLQTLEQDLVIEIKSEFSATIGFGSSSAIAVGMICALTKLIYQIELPLPQIFNLALQVVRQVQKVGSGADVAASTYGGVLYYNAHSFEVCKLPMLPPFYLIYAGYKTPTVEVIRFVEQNFKDKPQALANLYQQITNTVRLGVNALEQHDYGQLYQIFSQAFSLQQQLHLIVASSGLGSKISGSGLGDCVLSFNCPLEGSFQTFNTKVAPLGVEYV